MFNAIFLGVTILSIINDAFATETCQTFKVAEMNQAYDNCMSKTTQECRINHVCLGCTCGDYFKLIIEIPDNTRVECMKDIKQFESTKLSPRTLPHIKRGMQMIAGNCPATRRLADDCSAVDYAAIDVQHAACSAKASTCNKDHLCLACACPDYYKLIITIPDTTANSCLLAIKYFPGARVNQRTLPHIKRGIGYAKGLCKKDSQQ